MPFDAASHDFGRSAVRLPDGALARSRAEYEASLAPAKPEPEPQAKPEPEPLDVSAYHKGGGYYELPDGQKVRGEDAARAALSSRAGA